MNNPTNKPVVRNNPIDYRIKSNRFSNHHWIISIVHSLFREKKISYYEYLHLLNSLTGR